MLAKLIYLPAIALVLLGCPQRSTIVDVSAGKGVCALVGKTSPNLGNIRCFDPISSTTTGGFFLPQGDQEFKKITQFEFWTCALQGNGTVSCGLPPQYQGKLAPAGPNVSAIEMGYLYLMPIGCNLTNQQLNCQPSTPAALPFDQLYSAISAGDGAICGLSTKGDSFCAGIPAAPKPLRQITVANDDLACGIDLEGHAICWGSMAPTTNLPTQLMKQIAVGKEWTSKNSPVCGILKDDDSLACWGGDNPDFLSKVPNGAYRKIVIGNGFACAVTSDESLKCFGQFEGKPVSVSLYWDKVGYLYAQNL